MPQILTWTIGNIMSDSIPFLRGCIVVRYIYVVGIKKLLFVRPNVVELAFLLKKTLIYANILLIDQNNYRRNHYRVKDKNQPRKRLFY